jgi:hypothetical protein
MRVKVEYRKQEPDYRPLALALLDDILGCMGDAEYEAEYQEWLRQEEQERGPLQ